MNRRGFVIGAFLRAGPAGDAYWIESFVVNPSADTLTLTFYCHSVGLALHSEANPADSTRRWFPTTGRMDGIVRCDVGVYTRRLPPGDTLFLREVAPRVPLSNPNWDSLPAGTYRLFARVLVGKGVRANLGITTEGRRRNGPEGPPFMIPVGRATVK